MHVAASLKILLEKDALYCIDFAVFNFFKGRVRIFRKERVLENQTILEQNRRYLTLFTTYYLK